MNLDDLKNDWDQEPDGEGSVPVSLRNLKGKQSPVEKIRLNMKRELVAQVAAVILGAVVPYVVQMNDMLRFPYYLFYILLLALTIYFFSKFYFFYNKIGRMEWSTKESLYDLFYGAKLNIEIYKAFTYMFIPNALILGIFVIVNNFIRYELPIFSEGKFFGFSFTHYVFVFLLAFGFIYVLTEIWVKKSYGKYVKEVEVLIEEMRE